MTFSSQYQLVEKGADIDPAVKEKLAELSLDCAGTFLSVLGVNLTEVSKEVVKGHFFCSDSLKQPFGFLHGGVSVSVLETLCSIGAWLNIDSTKQRVWGIEINANHLRSVKTGFLEASAEPISLGRSVQVWEGRIWLEGDVDKLVSVSRCTLAVS